VDDTQDVRLGKERSEVSGKVRRGHGIMIKAGLRDGDGARLFCGAHCPVTR
jgi:hypothetical protein